MGLSIHFTSQAIMADDEELYTERTHLLPPPRHSISSISYHGDAASINSSRVRKEEQLLGETAVGERLPYNDYTTIDWLHDLVKDSFRWRAVHGRPGLRHQVVALLDACSGWIVAALIGTLTACVAFMVDMAVATVNDWKTGYCKTRVFSNKESCCTSSELLLNSLANKASIGNDGTCTDWHPWRTDYWDQFGIYGGWALLFGIISGSVTMTTKTALPAASPGQGDRSPMLRAKSTRSHGSGDANGEPLWPRQPTPSAKGKSMYMAAGSGIPEIKTILSGFVIPHFLSFKVLLVKAVGSIFAVSTGMCLGKEGPFVHISACVSNLVASCLPKYANNDGKLREILAAGVASGLSVAFGAPIGGVLFAYEEIATYFPRKVLWRAFVCSLCSALILRELNPTGTGRLVLFETNYGGTTSYQAQHYPVFVLLGVAGGVFGGVFCKLNFIWSRWFRAFGVIKSSPVLEVFLVVLATTLLQYPNPLTREPGDIIIKNLLVDCANHSASQTTYVIEYIGWLIHGTLVKLILTIITFGIKVPSGIIIPALDAGAFFGRLVGQLPCFSSSSPGIFAMVGAGAFLAGVSRMTISLAVVMFELTGDLDFIVPNMIGIMVAKWIADGLEPEGVYDRAQTVLGHPFLDLDASMALLLRGQQGKGEQVDDYENYYTVKALIPPALTMQQITVAVPLDTGLVPKHVLVEKLTQLQGRGLMDAGLVLVNHDYGHPDASGLPLGYIAQAELEYALGGAGAGHGEASAVPAVVRLIHPYPSYPGAISVGNDGGGMASAPATASAGMDSESPPTSTPDKDNGNGAESEGIDRIIDMTCFVDRTPLTLSASAPMEYAVEMFGKLGLRYLMVTDGLSGKLVGVVIKKRLVDWLDRLKGD
ncbi:hypothetical protein DV736_g2076, partial [Chaetothyriales sp. CBS 134916]